MLCILLNVTFDKKGYQSLLAQIIVFLVKSAKATVKDHK